MDSDGIRILQLLQKMGRDIDNYNTGLNNAAKAATRDSVDGIAANAKAIGAAEAATIVFKAIGEIQKIPSVAALINSKRKN